MQRGGPPEDGLCAALRARTSIGRSGAADEFAWPRQFGEGTTGFSPSCPVLVFQNVAVVHEFTEL